MQRHDRRDHERRRARSCPPSEDEQPDASMTSSTPAEARAGARLPSRRQRRQQPMQRARRTSGERAAVGGRQHATGARPRPARARPERHLRDRGGFGERAADEQPRGQCHSADRDASHTISVPWPLRRDARHERGAQHSRVGAERAQRPAGTAVRVLEDAEQQVLDVDPVTATGPRLAGRRGEQRVRVGRGGGAPEQLPRGRALDLRARAVERAPDSRSSAAAGCRPRAGRRAGRARLPARRPPPRARTAARAGRREPAAAAAPRPRRRGSAGGRPGATRRGRGRSTRTTLRRRVRRRPAGARRRRARRAARSACAARPGGSAPRRPRRRAGRVGASSGRRRTQEGEGRRGVSIVDAPRAGGRFPVASLTATAPNPPRAGGRSPHREPASQSTDRGEAFMSLIGLAAARGRARRAP